MFLTMLLSVTIVFLSSLFTWSYLTYDELEIARDFNNTLENIFYNNVIIMTNEEEYENKKTNDGLVLVFYHPKRKKALYCLPENKKDLENRTNYLFHKEKVSGNNTVNNYIYTESQSKLSYRLNATDTVKVGSGKDSYREYIEIEEDLNNFKCLEKETEIGLTKDQILNQIKWTNGYDQSIQEWKEKKHRL